jgi:hypothetical protein
MAFPPELTQKPRFSQVVLKKYEDFFPVISWRYASFRVFLAFSGKRSGMSKLMPRLGGHMSPYRTATMTNQDGAEAVEQVFKP